MSRWTRRMLTAAVAVGVALGLTASGPVSAAGVAQSTPGCAVTIDGVDLSTASSAGSALELDADSTVTVIAQAPGPITSVRVRLDLGPLGLTVIDEAIDSTATSHTEVVDVADIARWGAGLYKVEATTTGTVCALTAYLKIVGASPFTTPVGIAASVIALAGAAGLTLSAVSAARTAVGRGRLGAVTGALTGLGGVVLAQQQGITALDLVTVAGATSVTTVGGALLGWGVAKLGGAAAASG